MPHDYTPEIEAAFAAFELKRIKRVELPPLRFECGPYFPPQVEIGDEIECALYATVRVVGWSQGPLPWPQCHISGPRSLILFGDLERAVRVESARAVSIAWGVSEFSVHKWRRALEVARVNAGSKARWSSNVSKVISRAQNKSGLELAHARETRLKAEATKSKNGAHRHEWTPAMVAWMGVLSDAEIAHRLNRCPQVVARERRRRGIAIVAAHVSRGLELLDGGKLRARRHALQLTQSQVAARYGCTYNSICQLENQAVTPIARARLERFARALECPPADLQPR